MVTNQQNLAVSPQINPDLVTLPDSGALPDTASGSGFAWFGDNASGTYCGPDYANRATDGDCGRRRPPSRTRLVRGRRV